MTTSPTSGPGGGDSTGLTLLSKTLTDAQVKGLPSLGTTGFPLLDAQGADTVILPVAGAVVKYGAAYTNVNAGALLVLAHTGFNDIDNSPQVHAGAPTGFLTTTGDQIALLPLAGWHVDPAGISGTYPSGVTSGLDDLENLALMLYGYNAAAGDWTGGGAGNSLVVHLLYVVLSV